MSAATDAVYEKLVGLWEKVKQHTTPGDDQEEVLLLLCEAMLDLVGSIRLLSKDKHGISAMIVCRSMFEFAAATDVLSKAPDLIRDYIDFGKLTVRDVGATLDGYPAQWLNEQEAEYEAIKARLDKKKCHGGTKVEELIAKSQFDKTLERGEKSLYKSLYKEGSSLSHGDSYMFLSYRTQTGWKLELSPDDRQRWSALAESMSLQMFAAALNEVQKAVGMDLTEAFTALIPELESLAFSDDLGG